MSTNEIGSQRFNTRLSKDGKPMILWDTGQKDDSQKKKFGYKNKSVKYALRSKAQNEETIPQENVRSQSIASKPKAPNTKIAKNEANAKASKKSAPKQTKPKADPNTVTLTQAQFDQILDTIGELSVLADTNEKNTSQTGPGKRDEIDFDAPLPEAEPIQSKPPSAQVSVFSTNAQQSHSQTAPQFSAAVSGPPAVSVTSNEPTAVPGLYVQSPRYPDPRSVPAGPINGDVRTSTIGIPWKHMTRAERKRIEWERQRAEAETLRQQARHTEQLHQQGGAIQGATSQVAQTLSDVPTQGEKQGQPERFVLPHVKARLDAEAKAKAQSPVNAAPVASGYTNQPPTVPGLNTVAVTIPVSQTNIQGRIKSQPVAVPGLNNTKAAVTSVPQTVPGLAPQAAQTSTTFVGQNSGAMNVTGNAPVQNAATAQNAYRPLTKMELKKLQWEKERAGVEKEYDPWGRPGAGAPIKDAGGGVLADFNSRKPGNPSEVHHVTNEILRMSLEAPRQGQSQSQYAIPTQAQPQYMVPGQQQVQYVTQAQPQYLAPGQAQPQYGAPGQAQYAAPGQAQQNKQASGDDQSTYKEPPPAAIRSSFIVGAAAPDENRYTSAKERQRLQWLRDLEVQKEEQKRKKVEERRKDLEYFTDAKPVHQYNYDYKQTGLPPQHGAVPSQINQPGPAPAPSSFQPSQFQPSQFQPSQAQNTSLNRSVDDSEQKTYIRGQNAILDPKTREEKEKVREKELDYQRELKRQMDERQNEKQRERQKRWQEEAEEEAKLQAERDRIQRQVDSEQRKVSNKRELEERTQALLKHAIDAEKDRAEWEKHEKRMLKLRKGGHDISNFHANFEAKITPRDGATSVITAAPSNIPGLTSHYSEPRNQGPVSYRDNAPSVMASAISPAPLPPDDYNDVRSVATTGVHGGYTENRVLTPSYHRGGPNASFDQNVREFGIQADLIKGGLSRESTDIEYTGPIQNKKKVRVKSAAEVKEKKSSLKRSTYTISGKGAKSAPPNRPEISFDEEDETAEKSSVKRRPAWGYQNPKHKKKINQSERDPFHAEKQARREAMKARRQQTLESIANQNAPNVAKKTTAAMRARSRARDRKTSHDEYEFSEPSSLHVKSQNRITGEEKRPYNARSRSPAPNVMLRNFANEERESRMDRKSKMSDRRVEPYAAKSPSALNTSYTSPRRRSKSPPVPALKGHPRTQYNTENYDHDAVETQRSNRTKYGDRDPIGAPIADGDFVPFTRSTNVLDPAHADDPVPVSREASAMVRARQAYIQEHEPARYGVEMENLEDAQQQLFVPRQQQRKYKRDPIMDPSLVTDHPSGRQTRILQQLSDLRRGLMQKQRELELGLPPTEEVAG